MSREIKFRAWDTKNKKWLTAVPSLEYLLDDEDGCVSHHDYDAEDAIYFYPNNPLGNDFEGRIIYQQFTGLTDKNGVRVYEGDIVSWSEYQGWEDGRTFHGLYQVIWDQENLRYDFFDPFESAYWPLADTKFDQVVGNIFEHSKLLTHEP